MKVLLWCKSLVGLLAGTSLWADEAPARQATEEKKTAVSPKLRPVNFKEKQSGDYSVASRANIDEQQGHRRSDNRPLKLKTGEAIGAAGHLLLVATVDDGSWRNSYEGIRLQIINRSAKRATFSASNSCLYAVQEAQNESGAWQAIEKQGRGRPIGDCAVGFHRVFLDPADYWTLRAPRYSGTLKTKLRFRLEMGQEGDGYPTSGGIVIYSNEFDGSVNPEQLQ